MVINENYLHRVIEENIQQVINENDENEGFKDMIKSGANAVGAFFGNGPGNSERRRPAPNDTEFPYNLNKRFKAAATNFKASNSYYKAQELINTLMPLAKRYGGNATLSQVIRSAQSMKGNANSRRSRSINNIYN